MAIILSFPSTKAFGGQVTLAWDTKLANSTTVHLLKYGTTSRNYTSTVNVGTANTYTVSGLQDGATYYFAVTAFDSASKVESTSSNEILYKVPGTPAVTVNYTANPTTGTAPLAVTFQNTSTGNFTGWQWDFGDSTTSPAQNPVKVYGSPGTYTVSLTATSSAGTLTQTKQNFIQVAAPAALPPVAAFTATPTSGTAPLVVNFTDNSSGSINSWNWNFGDGTASNLQASSHTYNTAGNYTVTLNVSGPGGSSTKSGSISVTAGGSGGTSSGGTPSGLVAAYGFEEASGATLVDASGNGNHGTMQYTTRIANGRFGKALSLDGFSSLITVNDSDSLDLTTGMTLEAWVYNTATTAKWGTLLWKDTTDQKNGVYYLYGTTPSYGPVAGLLIGSNQELQGTGNFPTNTWVHLAATYDGQYLRLYVNGQQVAARAQQGAIPKSTGALRIGADTWAGAWGDCFKGYIDEVRIYNRALTPQEVVSDLNKSVATTTTNLVAAYGFEEASGATLVDASGKGNNGTMQYTNRIANGRFGKALSLDGVSSLITVNDSDSLDLTTAMTLEAWVYNTSTTANWGTLLWKDTTDGKYGVYSLYGTSPSYGPFATVLIGADQYVKGTANFPQNTWVHLAATYDGQYQRLYVNGQQVAARAQQGAITTSTGVLRIGADTWGGALGDRFKGYIDEVRIYNRALTAQEVVSDLNTSVANF